MSANASSGLVARESRSSHENRGGGLPGTCPRTMPHSVRGLVALIRRRFRGRAQAGCSSTTAGFGGAIEVSIHGCRRSESGAYVKRWLPLHPRVVRRRVGAERVGLGGCAATLVGCRRSSR